jgi:hypothetical protein
MDVQGRNLLAAERFELLRAAAQPSLHRPWHPRRRLGRLVIAVGLRLAPEGLDPSGSDAQDQAKRVIDCAELVHIEASG